MMGHAWNLLFLGLGIGMGQDFDFGDGDFKAKKIPLTEPLELAEGSTTPTIEENQVLAEILGITVKVECVPKPRGKNETPALQRRQEKRQIPCGSGYKCDSNSCGSGAVPVPPYPTQPPPGGSGGSRCKSYKNVQCNGWLDYYCRKYVTDYGSKCSGVYDQIRFLGKSICLDFCCYCPSVFNSCKCNCCKCLENTGGTCGNTECNIRCTGSSTAPPLELVKKDPTPPPF